MKSLLHSFMAGLLLLWGLPASSAPAATNQVQNLTLEQAIQMAEQKHPELAELAALVDASEGRVHQAGKFPNPEAIARMESAPIRGRTAGEAEYLAGISQTIPTGGRLSKAREAERLEREKRQHSLERKRREIRKRVHGAFATALYQEQARRTLEEIVRNTDRLTAVMKARVEAGDALPGDVARAELESFRAKAELQRSEALSLAAMAALRGAIGNPALSVGTLSGRLDSTLAIPDLEELASGLARTPAFALAEADVRESETRIALAKSQRIPDLKVDLLYRRLEREDRNAFDVGLSIPLPLFNRNQGTIRAAQAELRAAEARSVAARVNGETQLREAHAQLTAALAYSQSLKSEVLPRTETIRKTAESRHAAGDISLPELLLIQRDWAAAQLTYLESLRDVMQAWAELAQFLNH